MKFKKILIIILLLNNINNIFGFTNIKILSLKKKNLNIYCSNNKTNSIILNNNINLFNNNTNLNYLKKKYIYNNNKLPKILKYFFLNFSFKESELKHSRIAILAVIGRLTAESIHPNLALILHIDNLLVNKEMVPSLLNGGLNNIKPIFSIFTLLYISLIELIYLIETFDITNKKEYINNIFDPLNIYNNKSTIEKNKILNIELNFGRISMLLSTWFTYYEFITKQSIINNEILPLYPWLVIFLYILIFT